jgi:phospholipid/cholesterol/gamma-HCH transport system ATP-binding protein
MTDENLKSDGKPMIRLRGVTRRLGRQSVLNGVDLAVESGETLVIMGRSGGGKSVTLKHIIGLMKPDSGTIEICGRDIVPLSERQLMPIRRQVGMLFQSGALFDSFTVEENIAFPLREMGERDESVVREKVRRALEVVELTGHGRKMPENLSGGMRKRVGLARAIISEPQCVLYDEPTSGLDPIVTDSIDKLILRLQKTLGVTSVVVTHDVKSAFHIGDRIAYLHKGKIYFHGTPDEMRASEDPLVKDFVDGRSGEMDEE